LGDSGLLHHKYSTAVAVDGVTEQKEKREAVFKVEIANFTSSPDR
jgi:hypothetical protein